MEFSSNQPTNPSSVLYAMNVTLTAVKRIKTLINREAAKLDPNVLGEISSYLTDLESLLSNKQAQAYFESSSEENWDEDDEAIQSGWNALNQRIINSQKGHVA